MHNMPPHAGLTGGAIAGIAVVGAFGVIVIAAAIITASTIYKRQKQANPPPRRADYAEINPHDAELNDQQ